MTYYSGYLVGGGRSGLGDVGDGGSFFWNAGNSLPAQLWGWVTGTVAEASDDPPAVQTWRAQVKANGSVAVRWPFDDPFRGELAERWANVDDTGATLGYSYALAPLSVINADRARRNLDAIATTVLLPLASAGLSVAELARGVAIRGAVVAAGAVLAVNLVTSLMRGGRGS